MTNTIIESAQDNSRWEIKPHRLFVSCSDVNSLTDASNGFIEPKKISIRFATVARYMESCP